MVSLAFNIGGSAFGKSTLLQKLNELLTLDWRQRNDSRAKVKLAIEDLLDTELPRAYTPELYQQKCTRVFAHVYAAYAQRGGSVQVSGVAGRDTARIDAESGMFLFDLTDRSGQTMRVQFAGAPPGNFDEAESVVVVGNLHDGVFEARKILVKCPSKYQAK